MNMTIDQLRHRRGTIKSSCTRIKTYVNNLATVDGTAIAQLRDRRARLETFWNSYDNIQTQIELVNPQDEDRETFEDEFYNVVSKIRIIIEQYERSSAGNHSVGQNRAPAPSTSNSQNQNVRLPKLNIPIFTGNCQDWNSFQQMFQTTIVSNQNLSKIEKFQYLISSIAGEAADTVQSLRICEENFDKALSLLTKRYDRKRIIVQSHTQSILDIPNLRKDNSQDLRGLINSILKHTQSLESLGIPVEHWGALLIQIISNKLDANSLQKWEETLKENEIPGLDELIDFLSHRCQTLESLNKKREPQAHVKMFKTNDSAPNSIQNNQSKCIYCKSPHPIYFCENFLKLAIPQRIKFIKNQKACINCLKIKSHEHKKCNAGSCQTCKLKHNTLLHIDSNNPNPKIQSTSTSDSQSPSVALVGHNSVTSDRNNAIQPLLSTALVHVFDSKNNKIQARALLDSGSQVNLISRNLVEKLGIPLDRKNISIIGINQQTLTTNNMATVQMQSIHNKFQTSCNCIVTNQITDSLPSSALNKECLEIPSNLKLADPNFNIPASVDLLLGVDIFWKILCIGKIKASQNNPIIQKTHLGWILGGGTQSIADTHSNNSFFISSQQPSLHESVQRFWELDEIHSTKKVLSPSDSICESLFENTTRKDSTGRFIVTLPFRAPGSELLGKTRHIALKRFLSMEKRLNQDPALKKQYSEFMNEYIQLDHMKPIDVSQDNSTSSFYLPHHCVFKSNDDNKKIRVVFDGSCKSDSGVSLNEVLHVGPVVQPDLFSTVSRFRLYPFVFTADITKMYRQVLVEPSQTRFQRILWRFSPSDPIQTYELSTVTYGTSSASFLATRALIEAANLLRDKYPLGAEAIATNFYVDDCLSGGNSLIQAIEKRDQILNILDSSKFKLDKWNANHPSLLDGIPNKSNSTSIINFAKNSDARILGLLWDPANDCFKFSIVQQSLNTEITKRKMLSSMASLFDPLGLIGPVILIAKLLIQEIWQLQLDWDSPVPAHIHTPWSKFHSQLHRLGELNIPRTIIPVASIVSVQIHGFADASTKAYGACIYIRIEADQMPVKTLLLASKSRVAPLKSISLPRLELCAALLLAHLFHKMKGIIEFPDAQCFLWTDSTITLAWIQAPSKKWVTFVSNRVGEIQAITRTENWHHISSGHNPADLISRGAFPSDLLESQLWWHGPSWLTKNQSQWPIQSPNDAPPNIPDQAEPKPLCNLSVHKSDFLNEIISKFSSINKLIRVLAYCFRFARMCKNEFIYESTQISREEFDNTLNKICKQIQFSAFTEEIRSLSQSKPINNKSPLASLNPFIDDSGLLRVGGRLRNSSQLSYDQTHPILLPRSHPINILIIRREHTRNLHAGAQATVSAVRAKFWPLALKTSTRKVIRGCITCFRVKPKFSEIIMSDLPLPRVTPSRPFTFTGVDYGGPFYIRDSKKRNSKLIKNYIAIFICFATKAIHIELAADLTSECFIAAFKRFIARRGKPEIMFSDNGTNFVGANKELKELHELLINEQHVKKLSNFMRDSPITWKFIPPGAPHFGGLWEAAVKSVKYHLKRTVRNESLNSDEMNTLLTEIESVLNSRPLCPLSDDPNDLQSLTPAHFLIGSSPQCCYEPSLLDIKQNRLSRWQVIQQFKQDFWRRWTSEYLHRLQTRTKWQASKGLEFKTGQLVLIDITGLPPLQWPLGRIEKLILGTDGNARSAIIKTHKGTITRPVSKLAILPLSNEQCN